MYLYYKGESENPFAKLIENAEIENNAPYPPESMKVEYNISHDDLNNLVLGRIFWEREMMFELQFKSNDFSLEKWCQDDSDKALWKKALNPPDKDRLFELWNKNSIRQLADKQEMDFQDIYKNYITIHTSIKIKD